MSTFEDQTAVEQAGPGVYQGRVHPGWWVVRGPHGGYLAAMVLLARRPARRPRRPPRLVHDALRSRAGRGGVEISTAIERQGRSMTTLSARMTQGDRLVALSLAAFSHPGPDSSSTTRPARGRTPRGGHVVPPPETASRPSWGNSTCAALGARRSRLAEALVGGWMRMADPTVVDAPAIACCARRWAPQCSRAHTQLGGLSTIDLTIHFRSSFPLPGAASDDFYLGRFKSTLSRATRSSRRTARCGARDGTLVAQSRQLRARVDAVRTR